MVNSLLIANFLILRPLRGAAPLRSSLRQTGAAEGRGAFPRRHRRVPPKAEKMDPKEALKAGAANTPDDWKFFKFADFHAKNRSPVSFKPPKEETSCASFRDLFCV
jgi:hypothetical protein